MGSSLSYARHTAPQSTRASSCPTTTTNLALTWPETALSAKLQEPLASPGLMAGLPFAGNGGRTVPTEAGL